MDLLANASPLALAAGAVGLAATASVINSRVQSAQGQQRLRQQREQAQTVEVGPTYKDGGRARRNAKFADQLIASTDVRVQTCFDLFEMSLGKKPNHPCLGFRPIGADGRAGPFEWQSYKEVAERRDAIGSALSLLGHAAGERVGLYSVNRPEWVITDLACQAFGWPSVALYDTLGKDAVNFIVEHAEIKLVVVAGKQLGNLLESHASCLKTVVCMDEPSAEHCALADKLKVNLLRFAEEEERGRANIQEHRKPVAEDTYTIMYTSGTTGDPKGVVLTHRNIVAEVAGITSKDENMFSNSDVHMSYLPLAHSFERAVVFTMLSIGGQVGFFQGNILELFNDIAELKPTFLVGAPRVWSRLHDKIMHTIEEAGGLKKTLFDRGFAAKAAALQNGLSTPFWDRLLFSKTKARLGGRVRFILSGSAPLDPKLAEFLQIVFCAQVLEGYGLTENAAGACITNTDETQFGHVGCPIPSMEVRLVDVAEMNYTSDQTPPTGEVCIRGPNVFKEYYKDQAKTEEVLEKDGWFHTGDIGRWNANGTLSIIDRKKNIFKLSQGEYVAVEYLEGVFARSPFAQQIWVYGNSFKRFLVAVVVPDPDQLALWKKTGGAIDDPSAIQEAILDDLTRVGKEARLHGFEYLKAIHVDTSPFSVDEETMTPTFKLRRPQLLAKYQKEVDAMYASLGE